MRLLCWIPIIFLLLVGCRSQQAEKRYPLRGEVVSVDLPNRVITVKHQDIPGLMPAMTMSFLIVDAKEIENLQPGDTITAEIVISESKGRLEKIVRAKKAGQEIAAPVEDPHRKP